MNVDPGTTVTVQRDPEQVDCDVCSSDGSTANCSPTGTTLLSGNLTLDFSCPGPQNVYSVTMKKRIGQS